METRSTSTLEMRQAVASDLRLVEEITKAAYAEYEPLLGGKPVPVTEDYAPRIQLGEVWIQETGGRPCGLAVIETCDDHLMVFSLAVLPQMQAVGCGQALLKWSESRCRQLNLAQLRLYTNAKMERNIRIYKAFGFEETGRSENPLRPGWVRVDMVKNITAE